MSQKLVESLVQTGIGMVGSDIFFSALKPLYGETDTQCSVQRVLNNINTLFGVSSSSLSLRIDRPENSVDFTYHTGVDKDFAAYYSNKRGNTDPISNRSTKYTLDEGFTMADLCNQYPDWGNIHKSSFLSFGYKDALLVNFYSRKGDRGVLVLRSDSRRGEFNPTDTHSISRISPHLRIALQAHMQLRGQNPSDSRILSTLGNSATAIFHISKSGQLIQANAEGYGILNRADGMSLQNNHIKLHYSHCNLQLKQLLNDILPTSSSTTRIIKIQRERERFFVARIVAFNSNTLHGDGATLIVCDPFRTIRSEALLCALFDLTSREANVAAQLGNGYELGDIAIQNGVSINTVKSQRSSIYGKIGIKNQMQLVRIVYSLGMLVEAEIQTANDDDWTLSAARNSLSTILYKEKKN